MEVSECERVRAGESRVYPPSYLKLYEFQFVHYLNWFGPIKPRRYPHVENDWIDKDLYKVARHA